MEYACDERSEEEPRCECEQYIPGRFDPEGHDGKMIQEISGATIDVTIDLPIDASIRFIANGRVKCWQLRRVR